jgi:transcriptional regulator with XRE-family HTH domain
VASFKVLFKNAEKHDNYWLEGALIEFTEGMLLFMEKQKINRRELARRLKVKPSYVTSMLRGDCVLTLKMMNKIACVLNTRLHVELRPRSSRRTKI